MDNDKLTMLKPRESTPQPDDADTLDKPFGLDKNDARDVNLQSEPSYGTDGVEPGPFTSIDSVLFFKRSLFVQQEGGYWMRD